jgi:uncharacterized membrane protein
MDAPVPASASDGEAAETGGIARIEAFSDGVFAIAITLLILEIRLPHDTGAESAGHARSLWLALAGLWPSYLAYVLSFLIVGIMWANHRNMFRYIARADHLFVMLNVGLLLFVSFIPFPTAVLADHLRDPDDRVAATVLYSASFLPTAIFYNVLWRYAASGRRLLRADADADLCDHMSREYLMGPIIYAVATAIAFVSPWISLGVHGLLAVLYVIPHKARP